MNECGKIVISHCFQCFGIRVSCQNCVVAFGVWSFVLIFVNQFFVCNSDSNQFSESCMQSDQIKLEFSVILTNFRTCKLSVAILSDQLNCIIYNWLSALND